MAVQEADLNKLEHVLQSETCSFERSWKNFHADSKDQESGLKWISTVMFFCLISNVLVTGMGVYLIKKISSSTNFASLALGKYIFTDIPLQVIFFQQFSYWYGQEGVRCRLCLLEPTMCGSEGDRWHIGNTFFAVAIVSAALVNQGMLKPATAADAADSEWMTWSRMLVGAVSILPFTTALLMSNDWILGGSILSTFALVPFMLGVIGVASIVITPAWASCICCETCCEDI